MISVYHRITSMSRAAAAGGEQARGGVRALPRGPRRRGIRVAGRRDVSESSGRWHVSESRETGLSELRET